MSSANDIDGLKAALATRVLAHLTHKAYTQASWASQVRIQQSEVSALKRGDVTRFSVERLLRLLLSLKDNVLIEITSPGSGQLTLLARPLTIGELNMTELLDILGEDEKGLLLIAGGPQSGRTTVLHALLSEHNARTDKVTRHYSKVERHPLVPTIRFETDDQIHERFLAHADVIGIDPIAKNAASPYTALHYASTSRVYATIEAPDAKRAIDQFMSYTGPPSTDAKFVAPLLIGILTIHLETDNEGNKLPIDWEFSKVTLDANNSSGYTVSIIKPFLRIHHKNHNYGLLQTSQDAKEFLEELARHLPCYRTAIDPEELELEINDNRTEKAMTVNLAKDRNKRRYDILITTDEPWREVRDGESPPETRLFGAPPDIDSIVSIAQRFLG